MAGSRASRRWKPDWFLLTRDDPVFKELLGRWVNATPVSVGISFFHPSFTSNEDAKTKLTIYCLDVHKIPPVYGSIPE